MNTKEIFNIGCNKIQEDKNTSYGNMTDITMKKAFLNELKIHS